MQVLWCRIFGHKFYFTEFIPDGGHTVGVSGACINTGNNIRHETTYCTRCGIERICIMKKESYEKGIKGYPMTKSIKNQSMKSDIATLLEGQVEYQKKSPAEQEKFCKDNNIDRLTIPTNEGKFK